jgi:hypothetical protein
VTGLTVNGAPYDKLWLPLAEIPEEATTTLGYTVQKAEPRATRMEAPPDFMAGDDAGR